MATNPDIDAYIADADDYARPILTAVRKAVHTACPDVTEELKWNVPAYVYKGLLCMTPAFKAHARVVFWKGALLKSAGDASAAATLSKLARMESAADLPSVSSLVSLLKSAVALNEQGIKVPKPARAAKVPLAIPVDILRALKRAPKALARFKAFSSAHHREYLDWIESAKKPETRARRIAEMITRLERGETFR